MQMVLDLLGFGCRTKLYNCRAELRAKNGELNSYLRAVRAKVEEIKQLEEKLNARNGDIAELVAANQELTKIIDEMKKEGYQVKHPKEVYWNNKLPKANIRYVGRPSIVRPGENNTIDVRLFITPQDFEIHGWVKNRKLNVKDPMKLEEILPKIYYKHQSVWFKYVHDGKNTLGHSEYWMYPYELREKVSAGSGGDCDDYMISLLSTFIAAGVPSWRVRGVVGGTIGNYGGHATVYVLDDDLNTWYHFNSTSINRYKKISDAPKWGDMSDGIGIDPKDVWFSFTDKAAWHSFETAASRRHFNKEGKDKFIIRRV